jgi:hypothetical protein
MTTITCTCKTCKTNSKGAGLSALVPASLLTAMGNTTKTRHGLVYSANDPSFVGRVTRERLNISAA